MLRVPQELLDFIDSWIASRPEPRPNRQDAIRHAIELRMDAEGALNRPLSHPEWGEMAEPFAADPRSAEAKKERNGD